MSSSDERRTPAWLFNAVNLEFDFLVDAAATKDNHLAPLFFSPPWEQPASLACVGLDGLASSWARACEQGMTAFDQRATVWCNPPYSRGSILKWCHKAEQEAKEGVTSVLLPPADTSTAYFHNYVLRHEHRFIKRRLSFEGAPRDKEGRLAPAKFGSVLVIFRPAHGLWTWR